MSTPHIERAIRTLVGVAAVVLAAGCTIVDPPPDASTGSGTDVTTDASGETGVPDAEDVGDADADVDGGRETRTVSTSEGPVRGRRQHENGDVWSFLGIPYAAPPTGERRWKPPKPPEERSEVLRADAFGPACPQPESERSLLDSGPTSEDCLTLNVWTPSTDDAKDLPVLVWIHGGGFIRGSSRLEYTTGTLAYTGRRLAEKGVVVVSINYRLGPLGFFAHPSLRVRDAADAPIANFGFLDQVEALDWVQRNIGAFGGDPGRVTLFGESAGGISVCGHVASSKSRGLFARGIVQSGGCPALMREYGTSTDRADAATDQGKRVAQAVGCAPDDLSCLRSTSADEIVESVGLSELSFGDGETFAPIAGTASFGQTMWKSIEADEAADVPLVVGMVEDEGTLFAQDHRGKTVEQYRQWVRSNFPDQSSNVLNQYPVDQFVAPWRAIAAIIGDVVIRCPTRWLLQARTGHGHRTYGYLFSHVPPFGERNDLGSFHGAEIPFVFEAFARAVVPRDATRLARRMQSYWSGFADSGRPGEVSGRKWRPYQLANDELLELRTPQFGTRTGFRRDACRFWAK